VQPYQGALHFFLAKVRCVEFANNKVEFSNKKQMWQ